MDSHHVSDEFQIRDVKMNELEKVIAQYQDKLNDVTSNYQQKIGGKMFCLWSITWTTNMLIAGILENKIIDNEMAKDYV